MPASSCQPIAGMCFLDWLISLPHYSYRKDRFTTKDLARLSRNQNLEYISRKDAKGAKEKR